MFSERPSYGSSFPHILELPADAVAFESASTNGKDFHYFSEYPSKKKIIIGGVSHTNGQVETPNQVANLICQALKHVDGKRLGVSTDCGFGREGLSRRIAYYKITALAEGAKLVRKELTG
ncbi:MAG: hypothetical protein ACE5PO_09440 [Candidatus Bathyarchaeia archaeon]